MELSRPAHSFSIQHFPFVYALLPNKTIITYNSFFFTKLKECCLENGLHLNPSVILSDFEGGIICSIALQFPVEIYRYWCVFLDSITFFSVQFPLCQHWPNGNWLSGNWLSWNWQSGNWPNGNWQEGIDKVGIDKVGINHFYYCLVGYACLAAS